MHSEQRDQHHVTGLAITPRDRRASPYPQCRAASTGIEHYDLLQWHLDPRERFFNSTLLMADTERSPASRSLSVLCASLSK